VRRSADVDGVAFQRFEIVQNIAAVRSASYTAECASSAFHSKPAACTARDNTVCPNARPPRVAVSKHENGWNGLRLWPVRRTAALRNPRSKWALWPTRIARWQPPALIAARTGLKIRSSAARSGRAPRKGWSGSMPLTSSALGSMFEPGNASTWVETTGSGTSQPSPSMPTTTAAISSNASCSASKPPVSTSTTTGRNPRKRVAIRAA